MKIIGRRKFFNKISSSIIGSMVISIIPFNLFTKSKHKLPSNLKVKIHPNSVSRNK